MISLGLEECWASKGSQGVPLRDTEMAEIATWNFVDTWQQISEWKLNEDSRQGVPCETQTLLKVQHGVWQNAWQLI